LVLAGGLLTAGRLGALVSDQLRRAGACVHRADEPVAGAAWLALLDIWDSDHGRARVGDPATVHVRLMSEVDG
ncbi:MAG: hypothetical protein ACRDTC_28495, partial [Pseudonocardiaceae bacterium]